MPPVGQKRRSGRGAASEASSFAPPTDSAGKSLSARKPSSLSAIASEAVAHPGRNGTGDCAAALGSAVGAPGLTRNLAPAATAWLIWSVETIVPAPTTAFGTFLAIALIASSAAGVDRK